MKINCIKSEKDLKAGNYIRAVINYHGRFWIEFVSLRGKPFNVSSPHMKGHRKISIRKDFVTRPYQDKDSFLGDLGVRKNDHLFPQKDKFGSALIPFSNKVWNHLMSIKTLKPFAESINNCVISDDEYFFKLQSFARQEQMDREADEQMSRNLRLL